MRAPRRSYVPALLGRNLGPSDSPDGKMPQPVAELHYRFWQRHFHGDPAILGKMLELEHKKYTIVGVTRPNFAAGWGTYWLTGSPDRLDLAPASAPSVSQTIVSRNVTSAAGSFTMTPWA